jgi:hypothetical protein
MFLEICSVLMILPVWQECKLKKKQVFLNLLNGMYSNRLNVDRYLFFSR